MLRQQQLTEPAVASFNHLIGAGEERGWDRETERAGRIEIDDKLEFGGRLDREVTDLLSAQDAIYVGCCLSENV